VQFRHAFGYLKQPGSGFGAVIYNYCVFHGIKCFFKITTFFIVAILVFLVFLPSFGELVPKLREGGGRS
jgi:hypothetical protein